MSEEGRQVAERLLGIVGDDDGVASSSHSWPAVPVGCGQSVVVLPPQHLETERSPCDTHDTLVEFKHGALFFSH